MGYRKLFSVIWEPLLAGLTILLVVATIDVTLCMIGGALKLGFTTEVWGTYSSWAMAVFPGVSIMASTHLWILDRRDKDRREVMTWSSMLRRCNGNDEADTSLYNAAPVYVRIVRNEGCRLREFESDICQHDERKYFQSSQGDIKVVIAGHIVRIRPDGSTEYVGIDENPPRRKDLGAPPGVARRWPRRPRS
ncbi:MAG: hypothetical protein FWF02_03000 [Micrococcales bacterium]|nr:hypothetical protein [Micrococcales bacterium]MCL2666658.1 hypothetical protein [Micrococcales bacterium]